MTNLAVLAAASLASVVVLRDILHTIKATERTTDEPRRRD